MKNLIKDKTFTCISNALITGILLLITLTAGAQNNWTRQFAEPGSLLEDVAYGAGKYVVVGEHCIIRTSSDGKTWETQPTNLGQGGYLLGIAYANGQFVAVGSNGVIITSPDGTTWTERNSATNQALENIAFGAGTFVAVGYQGTIVTSKDAVNWTTSPSGTTESLSDVAYGVNGVFIAVGSNGLIISSANGANWVPKTSGTTKILKAVTSGKNGNFVAVGRDGAILFSTNGFIWTIKAGADPKISYNGVACDPTTGSFVAVTTDKQVAATSLDGNYWGSPLVQTGSDFGFLCVRFVNNNFFGTGYWGEMRSSLTDGKTWYFPGVNTRKMNLNGAAFGNGQYVAVGNVPLDNGKAGLGGSNLIITSSDAVHYKVAQTLHLSGGATSFNDVAFGNGKFIAVGDDAIIQTSVDGKNWNYSYVNFGQTLTGVTYGNGRYVAIGRNGLILFSDDAKTWNKASTLTKINYNGVAFVNGQFVLVGQNGTLATSITGNDWTFRATGTNSFLSSVAYGGGKWMAVGQNNTVVTSTNGIAWTSQSLTPDNVHYTDVCYANGEFVMVGLNGQVYSTSKNNFWVRAYPGTNEHVMSITSGNGLFFAVGKLGTLTTSPFDNGPTIQEPENSDPGCGTCRTADVEGIAEIESEKVVAFNVNTYPNPVDDQFSVNVEGATGGAVRMQLMDLSGHTIFDKLVNAESGNYQETIPMSQQQTGMYLLRVSTSTKTQTMKILKK